uniref:HSac2 domain-containing protein n=1 Tax=Esox lucius TaxID=8010 RepID=A0A3P8XWB7_ESOLU
MSDGEAVTFKAVELDHPELGPEAQASPQVDPPQTSALPQPQNWTDSRALEGGPPGQQPEDKAPATVVAPGSGAEVAAGQWSSAMDQFKLKRFFVLRVNVVSCQYRLSTSANSFPVGASLLPGLKMVDHWNNERERVVLITENSLLLCKYDFVMLNCEQIQRIPLNFIDRISYGNFIFPQRSLLKREEDGVRVFWDRLREPSFATRWNPFATDYPFSTFTYHPVRNTDEKFTALCEIQTFREKLTEAAQKAHLRKPIPGKANGVLVLNQPLLIEAYVGLMSFIGNQNKLGYSLARGNIGF